MYDSVFSYFQKPEIPFEKDRTITPERKIIQDMGKIEAGGKNLLQKELLALALRSVDRLKGAIASGDLDAVNKFNWGAAPKLGRAIWGVWASGFQLGGNHAGLEVKSQRSKVKSFNNGFNNIVYFTEQENVERTSIRNTPAEQAIQQRVNRLAADVSNSEWQSIKAHIIDSISPPLGQQNPISRAELLSRINNELGNKSGRFANRAQTIARTELTFAYNAGRLDTYRRSGLVKFIRYGAISDDRTCSVCVSLNGLIVGLDDAVAVARITPPRHPACRCVISPVIDVNEHNPDDPDRQEANRAIVPSPPAWMTAAILAALLVGGIRSASGMRGRVGQIAREIGEVGVTAAGTAATVGAINQVRGQPDADDVPVTPTEPIEPEGGAPAAVSPKPVKPKIISTRPQVKVGDIDLNSASFDEIAALLPRRLLKVDQIKELIKYRDKFPLEDINDLYKIPKIGKKTGDAIKSLSQGLSVVTDLNNVRTWAQLWASNAGLTKNQAQALFDEIKRKPLESIDDLRSRNIPGVGEKSIDELIKRSFITQQSVKQRQKQTQVQRVGTGDDPIIPTPEGRSRPEALERGKRQPPEEPPEPEGGSPAPTPPRTPSPYSGGGVGRTEPTSTPQTGGQTPRPETGQTVTPPDQTGGQTSRQPIDPARQQALSNLGKQLDYLNGQASGLDADLFNEMSRKRLFGKSPNQVHDEVQNQASKVREQSTAISTELSNAVNQLDSLGQRTERMETVFENLTDPSAPNYFERVPQAISSAKAEVRRTGSSIDKALADIDKALNSLDKSTSSLDNAIKQASTKKIQQLEQGLEAINASLDDWNRLASQLEDLEDGGSEYLSQLQQLRDKQQAIQDKLAQSRSNTRSQYSSTLQDVGELKDELQGLRSQLAEAQGRIQQTQKRLDNLPTTRQQLDPQVRAQYDNSVEIRRIQKSFNNDLQQFRRTDRQVEQSLNQSAQNQLDFYNQYDQQFNTYEQSYSPLIENRLRMLNDDLQALSRYPQGTIAWLLEFGDRWQFEQLPSDLALALQGIPRNQQVERVRALAQDVQQQFGRARASINVIRENSEFKYLEGGQRLTHQEALARAENNLKYWQQQQQNLVSTENTGSSSNRLNSLAKSGGTPDPNDTLGLSRRIVQNLDEWQSRYQDLTKGTGVKPELVGTSERLEQLNRAKEAFLEEAGQSRINQSRIVNDALREAQEIYERVRADASKTPVFDINGKATAGTDVINRVDQLEQQLNGFKQLRAIETEPIPFEPSNVPRIQELVTARETRSVQLDELASQLEQARAQLAAAQEQGRGTKRIEGNIRNLQDQFRSVQDQINAQTQEIRDLRLPTGTYNRIQELSSRVDDLRVSQQQLSQQLSEATRELTSLSGQPTEGLSQATQKRKARIAALESTRDRLTGQIINSNAQVNLLLNEIEVLRRG